MSDLVIRRFTPDDILAAFNARRGFVTPIAQTENRGSVLPDNPAWRYFPWVPRSPAGVRVTHDTAFQVSCVAACIDVVAKAIAMSPWNVFKKVGRDDRDLLPNDTIQYLLNNRPNPEMTALSFREALMIAALSWGNGYAEIVRDGNTLPYELWPIAPDRVQLTRNTDWQLVYRVSNENGDWTDLAPMNVLHIKGPGITGLIGDDIIVKAVHTIGLTMAAERFGETYFGNNTQMGGLLKLAPGAKLNDEALDQLKRALNENSQGPNRAHKTIVLENAQDYQQLGANANESQLVAIREFQIAEVCRWFGVPPHKIADLSRCMPADTLVYTAAGPKPIADILPGDEVWAPTPSGPKLARVLNHWNNGVRPVLKIRTTNRTVRCTTNHRLLVRRSHERPLNPGEIGGRNVNGQKMRIHWRNEYVQASDLCVGDTLVTLSCLPNNAIRTAPNGRNLSVGFLEFAGLLMADGNISYSGARPCGIQISRGARAGYMSAYRAVARKEFVRYSHGVNPRCDQTAVAHAEISFVEGERTTSFKSVMAAQELFDLGFSGTAFTKRVPSWVFGLTVELRLAFLRGFLDGDGTCDRKGRITYYSASKPLIDQVRHLCIGCGIPVTNSRSDVNGAKAFGNGTRMWRFTCSDPGANKAIGSHDPRYIERLAAGKPFARKDRNYPRFGGKESMPFGIAIARITDIEEQTPEPVFDIEVEGEHCFFADGVASHNSTNNNIEHQGLEFVRDALTPWARRNEQEADYKLFPSRGIPRFTKIDLEPLSQGDAVSRGTYYTAMRSMGAYSVNDILKLEGKNTIGKEGDIRIVNSAFIPLEDVGTNLKAASVPAPVPATPDETLNDGSDASGDTVANILRTLFGGEFERIESKAKQRRANLIATARGKPIDEAFAKYAREVQPTIAQNLIKPCELLSKLTGCETYLMATRIAGEVLSGGSSANSATEKLLQMFPPRMAA